MSETQGEMPVPSITNFRMSLDMYINSIPFIRPSREVSLAHTHLQRAFMWLGKAQGATGSESPYKESLNHKTTTIEPTADHGPNKFDECIVGHGGIRNPYRQSESLRAQLAEHNKQFKEFLKGETYGPDYDMYLKESRLAVEEASMWLGWELARIKKEQDNAGLPTVSAPHHTHNLPL